MAGTMPPINSPGRPGSALPRMAVITAIISAPPIWMLVLTSPEASPCSSSDTPAVAWELTDGNVAANPMPRNRMVGSRKTK